ncbi:MAG: ATPase subunit of ABC transporter with duplicated ATPase domains [bacterium]|jgi:ATPase subunit of ABC transporter with duplicated ATPase domains
MVTVSSLTLNFGSKVLFADVNLKFAPGNCYGVIGANGSGKSTFLKILSGEIGEYKGTVSIAPTDQLAVLKQNHFEFDDIEVLQTVLKGHTRLCEIIEEKETLYANPDFSEADGIRTAELETEFAELDGWNAESEASILLAGLGISEDLHYKKMKELSGGEKVKILLAQTLFGKPDILLLDEPTNHLDVKAIYWLENFLLESDRTVIVVSHDRHFLNKVCTHIVDIDYGKMQIYVGNYDFWSESSQLAQRLAQSQNKKSSDKAKELKAFIQRFSANASKAKQATSRRKQLEKLTLDDIRPSTRKYPFFSVQPEREAGKQLLQVDGISKKIDGVQILKNVSFLIEKGDKAIFLSNSHPLAVSTLFQILAGEMEADEGTFEWGVTTRRAYLPKDNSEFFNDSEVSLIDWLRVYSKDQSDSFIRGFLGKMLFSGEEVFKKTNVLSGGEKVRCMLSKIMLSNSNVLLLDEPTNHLDLESITSVNNGLISYAGTALFSSHDHQFIQTIATRVIELTAKEAIPHDQTYDEYLGFDV